MATDSEVMNAVDAAAFLGVHVETLRKLGRRNEIPCFKIGRDWRFRKEALLRWADEQRSGGGDVSALVIDDEDHVGRAIARSLRLFGCRTRQAISGHQGLDMVAQEVPDVILLDLKMPDMNGPQFLKELRKTHPRLPVVLVTGYPDSDLMAQAMQHAPVMLLSKPVERELLERTVRSLVGNKATVVDQQ